MSKLVISSYAEFEQYAGKELGVSDWVKISQPQINQFADATLDHQWIHTDPERAARETEFKSTIAPRATLPCPSCLTYGIKITEFHNIKMMINYGIENSSSISR